MPAKKKPAAVEEAPKRPRGRQPIPEEDRAVVGTIRLTQAHWDKLAALGGVRWIRERIDKARKLE